MSNQRYPLPGDVVICITTRPSIALAKKKGNYNQIQSELDSSLDLHFPQMITVIAADQFNLESTNVFVGLHNDGRHAWYGFYNSVDFLFLDQLDRQTWEHYVVKRRQTGILR